MLSLSIDSLAVLMLLALSMSFMISRYPSGIGQPVWGRLGQRAPLPQRK